jgi:hypothetical protein
MNKKNSFRKEFKTGLILPVLFLYLSITTQAQEFKVLSSETNNGIGYVNIGVLGKNKGTVTDESGRFTLNFTDIGENDSLRFSMIGYESRTFSVSRLKGDPSGSVFLTPKTYKLPELNIVYPRGKEVMLGTPVLSNALRSGFTDNNLGSELGIKVNIRKRLKIKDINFNVGVCTFDSVTYRLNIYRLSDQEIWENILTQPVYLSFAKNDISKAVTFDLKNYSIIIEGEIIITLEHYRELGEGRLLFLTQFFTGTTWHRKTKESIWTQSPGQVGMYLNGQTLR